MDIAGILYWIFGSTLLPAVVPWLIYKFFFSRKVQSEIRGKVVLITGASSGLGEALSRCFYRAGCKVILASRREPELTRVKNELLKLSTLQEIETFEPKILVLDLADLNSLAEKAQTALNLYGKIDILINNGGISVRGNILSTSLDVHMKIMMINYFGAICLTKALLPSFISQKSGHIVSIGSVQGRISLPYRSAYGASKHALTAYMDCLRAEVARFGIKVTLVSPGYMNTKLSENALTSDGTPYGRLDSTTSEGFSPQDVAVKIFNSILQEKKDVVISESSPKVAIILRALCPSLYFFIMERRAARQVET